MGRERERGGGLFKHFEKLRSWQFHFLRQQFSGNGKMFRKMIHQWLKLNSVGIICRVYKAILFKLNKIQGSRGHQIKVRVIQGFQGLLDTLSQLQEINFDRTLITQIRPLNKCTCFFLLPGYWFNLVCFLSTKSNIVHDPVTI